MLVVRRRTFINVFLLAVIAAALWYFVPRALPPRLSLRDGAPAAAQPAGAAGAAGGVSLPGIPVGSAGESGSLGLDQVGPGALPAVAPIGGAGGSGMPVAADGEVAGEGSRTTAAARAAARAGAGPIRFNWPMLGDITSYYGPRDDEFHTGIDIAAVTGQAVRAAMDGTVIEAGWRGGYGLCVVVDHGNGLQTLYAHNSKLEVEIGDKVEAGHLLALAGSTGYSTGPHLHFEILLNGLPVNPMPWLEP